MKSVVLVFITDESKATYTNVEIVHIFKGTNVSPLILPFLGFDQKYFIILSHNNIINNEHFVAINNPT